MEPTGAKARLDLDGLHIPRSRYLQTDLGEGPADSVCRGEALKYNGELLPRQVELNAIDRTRLRVKVQRKWLEEHAIVEGITRGDRHGAAPGLSLGTGGDIAEVAELAHRLVENVVRASFETVSVRRSQGRNHRSVDRTPSHKAWRATSLM